MFRKRRQIAMILVGTAVLAVVFATVPGAFRTKLHAAYATLRGRGASLEIDRTVLDLGQVEAGPVLSAFFDVRNTGGKRLLLTRQPSGSGCNCLKAEDLVNIPPGARQSILLKLATRDLEGPLRLKQTFQTNDKRLPLLELEVLAMVHRNSNGNEGRQSDLIEPIPMQIED